MQVEKSMHNSTHLILFFFKVAILRLWSSLSLGTLGEISCTDKSKALFSNRH